MSNTTAVTVLAHVSNNTVFADSRDHFAFTEIARASVRDWVFETGLSLEEENIQTLSQSLQPLINTLAVVPTSEIYTHQQHGARKLLSQKFTGCGSR